MLSSPGPSPRRGACVRDGSTQAHSRGARTRSSGASASVRLPSGKLCAGTARSREGRSPRGSAGASSRSPRSRRGRACGARGGRDECGRTKNKSRRRMSEAQTEQTEQAEEAEEAAQEEEAEAWTRPGVSGAVAHGLCILGSWAMSEPKAKPAPREPEVGEEPVATVRRRRSIRRRSHERASRTSVSTPTRRRPSRPPRLRRTCRNTCPA